MRQNDRLRSLRSKRALAAVAAAALTTSGLVLINNAPATADEPADRAEAFEAAADEYSVPSEVLLGVSYMQSRWNDHDGAVSVSGGYGPMHLTDPEAAADSAHEHHGSVDPRGDSRRPMSQLPEEGSPVDGEQSATLAKAAKLTGEDEKSLREDPAANIRGGAALLADYFADYGDEADADDPFAWYEAVARYSGTEQAASGAQFADFVYEVIETGAEENTDGGTVTLEATPGSVDSANLEASGFKKKRPGRTDCPRRLKCEWIPAPYEQYGETAADYGNHDKAKRDKDIDIDYIVVHATETSYTNTLELVQNPEYVSWQYSMRSFDGHVAQHLKPKDIGWQAGNWSMNMRSIGIEHEGVSAEGSWFTEAMYKSSAKLVKHLAKRYDIPLDREHIIGHDNVPGTAPENVKGMHWDPGPYWDWEHYFELMDAKPKAGDKDSGLVTVAPSFEENSQEFVGCTIGNPEASCGARSASTVFVHSKPDEDSPLLNDPGIDPSGEPASKAVDDVGSRVGYGQTYAVADTKDDWTAIWYLGQKGWIHNPKDNPVLIPGDGVTISPKSDDIPVYGVAFPEAEAYEGTDVPVQEIEPLPYTLDKGQLYSAANEVKSQYYFSKEIDGPRTVVTGDRTYYEVQIGGRLMYLDTADVTVK